MRRIFCLIIALLCLVGMMPVHTHALEASWQISADTIRGVPVMKPDISLIRKLPGFGGASTMDIGDNEYDELEPNDVLNNANRIENDYTVYGTLSATDLADCYVFTLDQEMEILVVSLADKESLVWAIFDDQGEVLGISELVDTIDGMFFEGMGGTLPAGTYFLAAMDENKGDVEYVFYFQTHIHTYETKVVQPTCTQEGYTAHECACGHTYKDNTVPALGHDFDENGMCTRCGEVKNPYEGKPLSEMFTAREWEVLKLTNRERLAQGLVPLAGFGRLQHAADIRAQEIVEVFDHTRPDGSSCFTAIDEAGLICSSMGENIAMGQTTPEWVVNSWMNSDGHRANILNTTFGYLGVGEVDNHWVQLFCGNGGTFTSVSVTVEAPVAMGTTINDMNLAAVLDSEAYGTCYLPVEEAYCHGYDPNKAGVQTVTISVLGISSTFEIEVKDHDHDWKDATCTEPKTCSICGATEGEALGHSWKDATCTAPKTCTNCGATEGEVGDHTWKDATCTAPKTCTNCGATEGEVGDHTWKDATCTAPKTCTNCGATEGEVGDHTWKDATCTAPKTCTTCGATEGEIGEHTWKDATCTEPKTCTTCGKTEGTVAEHTWKDATCTAPKTCSVCGATEGKRLAHTYEDGICTGCGRSEKTIPMYRLYNPYTLEHLLTSNEDEMDQLVSIGWLLDGIAWNAPKTGVPVYRLYNPYDDWHTYTMSQEEIDMLVPLGWKVDGVICYSATEGDVLPIYRLFNPYELKNYHLLTASTAERDLLEKAGWIVEGVAWQAVK